MSKLKKYFFVTGGMALVLLGDQLMFNPIFSPPLHILGFGLFLLSGLLVIKITD